LTCGFYSDSVFTPQEKNRKKKKIKAIKNKNRIATIDNEVTAVQTTWQNFVTKVGYLLCAFVLASSLFCCVYQDHNFQHFQFIFIFFFSNIQGSKRSLSGLAKSSQFATTSSLEGKLGVVNSGKGMTTFGERKKHKFDL
jgi:hypothetical protein